MKILLAYPGHSWSTIDVALGYHAALVDLGHEVKAYNYHRALAFYHLALEAWSEHNPAADLDPNLYLLMASERIIFDALDLVPDIVLLISGHALHRRAFDLLYRLDLPIALVATESPYLDQQIATIIDKGHVALTFTNDRSSCGILPGEVEYLPHAYDPKRHHPQEVTPEFRSDIFFHGTLWPERRPVLQAAEAADPGAQVRITGVDPAIPDPAGAAAHLENFIDNEELAKYYAGAKIAINHHRTYIGTDNGSERHLDRPADSLGPRAYEIAACGAFQICDNTRPELGRIFGDTVPTYDPANLPALQQQLRYYLQHDEERLAMASEAADRVRDCTFMHRAQTILIPKIEEVI